MTKPSQQLLAEHAANTLPDSITARRVILKAILENLTVKHPAHVNIRAQLAALDTAEEFQRELPLRFQEANKS